MGKPGRSGGRREGAGRPPGPAKLPQKLRVKRTNDPLKFLLGVMSAQEVDIRLRVRAAVSAAQYCHAKRGEGGKKEEQERAAKTAAAGKFAPAPRPKLIVDNTTKGK